MVVPAEDKTVLAAGSPAPDLLAVSDLSIDYRVKGESIAAAKGVSFTLRAGEFVALVGESGSGKSTLARAILGVLPRNSAIRSGHIRFDGHYLLGNGPQARRRGTGGRIALIPQEPITAFDPLSRIGHQVAEALIIHTKVPPGGARSSVLAILGEAGFDDPERVANHYPFELSGGMLQRALIAAALIGQPDLIVADEPTSALDVIVQKQVLDRLCDMCAVRGTGILFITHDLGVAADRADRIITLNRGSIVADGLTSEIMRRPHYARFLDELDPRSSLRSKERQFADDGSALPLLSVKNVSRHFHVSGRGVRPAGVRALDDVTLSLETGRTLAVVGASGSGKSTLGRIVLGLDRPTSGSITLDTSTWDAGSRRLGPSRTGQVQLIAQDTVSAFDPRWTAIDIVSEPLRGLLKLPRMERHKQARTLFDKVRLPLTILDRLPHELSGGQRQRLAIARALAATPRLIVCDEPVSALDHSTQTQIIDLLIEIQREQKTAFLFITHDLAIARAISSEVIVMRIGKIVEGGSWQSVLGKPRTAYTRDLVNAFPGALYRNRNRDQTSLKAVWDDHTAKNAALPGEVGG